MADTPTTRLLLRKQSLGSNTNTWGDTKLNVDLDQIDRAMVGYQAYTVTADATLSWTNYSASNDFEVFAVKLVGSPAAAVTITVNSTQMRWKIWNACGQTVTIETAAGNGVAIRNGNIVDLICDATDVVLVTSTQGGKSSPTTGTNDIPAFSAVESAIATAIAAASISNTGQVLVSVSDTTSGYLGAKLVAGTGIDTTDSGAGNATLTVTVDTTELEEFLAVTGKLTATLSSGTTAMTARRRYQITATATGTLPTMVAGDFVIVELPVAAGDTATIGRNSQTIDGASADDTYVGDGLQAPVIRYDYVSAGVVTSRLIEGTPA